MCFVETEKYHGKIVLMQSLTTLITYLSSIKWMAVVTRVKNS